MPKSFSVARVYSSVPIASEEPGVFMLYLSHHSAAGVGKNLRCDDLVYPPGRNCQEQSDNDCGLAPNTVCARKDREVVSTPKGQRQRPERSRSCSAMT